MVNSYIPIFASPLSIVEWLVEILEPCNLAKILLTSILIHFDSHKALVLSYDVSCIWYRSCHISWIIWWIQTTKWIWTSNVISINKKTNNLRRSILSGVRKFVHNLYGHHFDDHKPLLSLLHEHHAVLSMYYFKLNSKMGVHACSPWLYA